MKPPKCCWKKKFWRAQSYSHSSIVSSLRPPSTHGYALAKHLMRNYSTVSPVHRCTMDNLSLATPDVGELGWLANPVFANLVFANSVFPNAVSTRILCGLCCYAFHFFD